MNKLLVILLLSPIQLILSNVVYVKRMMTNKDECYHGHIRNERV